MVFILGTVQNSNGHSPGQLALGDPALIRVGGLDDIQRSLPTSTILWFPVISPKEDREMYAKRIAAINSFSFISSVKYWIAFKNE